MSPIAERSSLNQTIQIGVEATPGTSVAGSKKFTAVGIEPSPNFEMDQFKPIGDKYKAITTLGKEWIEAAISGRGSYNELVYLLSSVVNTAVITTPGGGTLSRNWQFISSNTADDVPKTYTVEHGSPVRADKFVYGIVSEFGISFNRTSVEVTGSMLGRAIVDAIVLTGAPTTIALQPIVPTEVSVYMDTTSAALGTTKMTRLLQTEFHLGGRFLPVYVVDSANPSFVATVEGEPDLTLNFTVEADAQGMGPLVQARDGSTRFVRIVAIGSIIEAAITYKLQIDVAVKIMDTGGFSDSDGVYAVEWNFVGVNNAGWGKAFEINMVNVLTAL